MTVDELYDHTREGFSSPKLVEEIHVIETITILVLKNDKGYWGRIVTGEAGDYEEVALLGPYPGARGRKFARENSIREIAVSLAREVIGEPDAD